MERRPQDTDGLAMHELARRWAFSVGWLSRDLPLPYQGFGLPIGE